MSRRIALALALTLVLVQPALGQEAATATAETFEQDTPRTTPAGTTFTVPDGWTMTTQGSMVVLDPPEAEEMLRVAAAQRKAAIATERERLTIPADPAAVAKLAARYVSPALGEVTILKEANATVIDAGEWRSTVASRTNDDGTISFITIDPTISGLEFVVADEGGSRRLITRDAQHEYVFTGEAPAAKN